LANSTVIVSCGSTVAFSPFFFFQAFPGLPPFCSAPPPFFSGGLYKVPQRKIFHSSPPPPPPDSLTLFPFLGICAGFRFFVWPPRFFKFCIRAPVFRFLFSFLYPSGDFRSPTFWPFLRLFPRFPNFIEISLYSRRFVFCPGSPPVSSPPYRFSCRIYILCPLVPAVGRTKVLPAACLPCFFNSHPQHIHEFWVKTQMFFFFSGKRGVLGCLHPSDLPGFVILVVISFFFSTHATTLCEFPKPPTPPLHSARVHSFFFLVSLGTPSFRVFCWNRFKIFFNGFSLA